MIEGQTLVVEPPPLTGGFWGELGVRDKAARNGPHAHIKTLYNKPEVRKRITGSTAATEECRLNIQRATANPNAA